MKVALKAKNLLEILARKNKPQNWLAHRMNISSGYMSQLITGVRCPSPRMRERLLKVLDGVAFDELFEIKEEVGGSR